MLPIPVKAVTICGRIGSICLEFGKGGVVLPLELITTAKDYTGIQMALLLVAAAAVYNILKFCFF